MSRDLKHVQHFSLHVPTHNKLNVGKNSSQGQGLFVNGHEKTNRKKIHLIELEMWCHLVCFQTWSF